MEMLTVHTVKRTDSLETLSAKYRVPVCMIMRANSLKTVKDFANCRKLNIPRRCYCNRCAGAEKTDWLIYTVQPGDTLFSIAKRHGVTMNIVCKANNIVNPESLCEGDKLSIPVVPGQVYYVREGETLQTIALAHNISESRLRQINRLKAGDRVHAGMQLLIG